MKTSELTDRALDWAVAKAKGTTVFISKQGKLMGADYGDFNPRKGAPWWHPSGYDWAVAGRLIDDERICVRCLYAVITPSNKAQAWSAEDKNGDHVQTGDRAVIAILRCYVASKLGDDVEIPLTLLGKARSKT
jgi:hypothetical protein